MALLPVAMLHKAPHATTRLSITYCDNIALTLHCLNLLQNSVEIPREKETEKHTHTCNHFHDSSTLLDFKLDGEAKPLDRNYPMNINIFLLSCSLSLSPPFFLDHLPNKEKVAKSLYCPYSGPWRNTPLLFFLRTV